MLKISLTSCMVLLWVWFFFNFATSFNVPSVFLHMMKWHCSFLEADLRIWASCLATDGGSIISIILKSTNKITQLLICKKKKKNSLQLLSKHNNNCLILNISWYFSLTNRRQPYTIIQTNICKRSSCKSF